MKGCEQAPGYSTYQHGLDVANRYRGLWDHLNGYHQAYSWSVDPDDFPRLQALQAKALSPKDARLYHIFHDCGKPRTLTLSEDGKRHFPGHAEASAKLFREAYPQDEQTAELIAQDMLCHTVKPVDFGFHVANPLLPTLLLTAWAELHANAEVLFRGFESDSFKIKLKRLRKLTKRANM